MSRFIALALLALLGGCARGGPVAPNFTLGDQRGAPWTLSAQRGKAVAVFFGYTHCADTCPAVLAKLASAIASEGSAGANAEIAFVTVDPQRDTPAVLAKYITRFSGATIVGLTGTQTQVAGVERDFHVWAQKLPGRRGAQAYDEAHTAIIFVIDRNGRIASMGDDSDTVAAIAQDIRKALE